jgi:putative DNA primase/helicase
MLLVGWRMSPTAARADTSFNLDVIQRLDLARLPQFVAWRPERRGEKLTKIPVNARTGNLASVTDPASWCDLDRAAPYARAHDFGIGFVFAADPYTGVDLDGCRNPETGAIAPWARAILLQLCSYSEISPSRSGVKIIIAGTLRDRDGRRRGPVEVYSRRRFFTLTGRHVDGTPPGIQLRQKELDDLVATLWPPAPITTVPHRRPRLALDDGEVLTRAMRARNGGAFTSLWRGEWQAAGYASHSEADLALLSHLAFWTNGDGDQMERLFAASGLARSKWSARVDYRARTVARALAGVGHA